MARVPRVVEIRASLPFESRLSSIVPDGVSSWTPGRRLEPTYSARNTRNGTTNSATNMATRTIP